MSFDIASHFSRVILEEAAGRIEGVTDGDVDILVRMVLGARMPDMDVLARNGDAEAYVVELSLPMVAVRSLYDDIAADDAIVKVFELVGHFADARFDGWRGLHILKADPQRSLHEFGSCSLRFGLNNISPAPQFDFERNQTASIIERSGPADRLAGLTGVKARLSHR
jgi:hypothetical protein